MPKIDLLNGETGKLESFEPIDAREILAQPDTIYSVPDETREGIGGPTVAKELKDGESVPQLQGADAEMQTGLPIEKYGRAAVVKAQVGDPGAVQGGGVGRQIKPPTDDIDVMTVAQLREYAETRGIDLGEATKKADIVAKVKAAA